jgi:hypothetical protein
MRTWRLNYAFMPKWLQGMIAPTLTLWCCMVAFGIASAASSHGAVLPMRADLASRVVFPLVMASWVMADAQKRGRRLAYDYGSFVFFAWPIIVPIYLFQTRGSRAFLTLLSFLGICVIAMLAASVVFIIREFA